MKYLDYPGTGDEIQVCITEDRRLKGGLAAAHTVLRGKEEKRYLVLGASDNSEGREAWTSAKGRP